MKADNAVEWFKEHGGMLTINRSPASKEAREAWGAKYADVIIEQAGTAVTVEQAERYACQFAAEQLREAADATFTEPTGEQTLADWLRKRAAELEGVGSQ